MNPVLILLFAVLYFADTSFCLIVVLNFIYFIAEKKFFRL